jgi:cholesterol transport system auxiliary component
MNARDRMQSGYRHWRRSATLVALATLVLLGGCGAIRPLLVPATLPDYYALSYTPDIATAAPPAGSSRLQTLIVSTPHAAAGFDSRRMMYLRHADQLEYFAYNEWIDTPARMLAPLLVAAIGNTGSFRAVVQTPSPAAGELRLDTEILRLQQEFLGTPSRVRLTLRATLVDSATRRVMATRQFEAVVAAASDDPHGGVTAANRAVQTVLGELAAYCAEAAELTKRN